MYLISGMHRSGTSLVARLFHEAGADLGDVNSLYPADRWNPGGYYEQGDIHSINIPLVNGPWGKLAYLRLPSTETILTRAKSRGEQIAQTAMKYSDKVVKETRFCLTLPAWLAHGTEFQGVLVCLRHPAAVVRSLRKRNWITHRLGYHLWRVHIERLMEYFEKIPFWFVRYESILDLPKFASEFAPAARFFQLSLSDVQLDRLYNQNVQPSWNRQPSVETSCPPLVEQLWERLLSLHAAQFNRSS